MGFWPDPSRRVPKNGFLPILAKTGKKPVKNTCLSGINGQNWPKWSKKCQKTVIFGIFLAKTGKNLEESGMIFWPEARKVSKMTLFLTPFF